MTTIIIIIAAVLVIGYIIYLSAKSKKHTQRTGTENIVLTAGNSWKRKWKKIGDEYRSPEKIKEELKEKIDTAFEQLKNSLESAITQLVTSEDQFTKIVDNCKKKIPELETNIKENKKKYIETKEEKYKSFCEKYILSLITNKKLLETAEQSLITIKEQISDTTTNYDLAKYNLEEKRMNILTLISDPQNTINFAAIDLSDLTSEFTEKLDKQKIKIKTSNIINGVDDTNTIQSSISTDEIQNMFDKVTI